MKNLKQSGLGSYSGYSEPLYDGVERQNKYVTMSDGVKIAVVCYIPTKNGALPAEPLPAVFHQTPYDRLSLASESLQERYARTMSDLSNVALHDTEGMPVINGSYTDDDFGYMKLLPYGYIVMVADVRGVGASFGTRYYVNSPREAQDGAELIEWLAGQSFCNGKIGSCGYSYTGQTQMKLLTQRPKHLTAAFIGMTDYNKYDGWVRGGIPRAYGTSPDYDWGTTEEEIAAAVERQAAVTVPVDGDEDRTLLRQAIREHVREGSQCEMLEFGLFRDSGCAACPDKVWEKISASTYKDEINACGTAVYLMGGAYDCFRRDTFLIYQNITLPKKMSFGPWYHMSAKLAPDWELEMRRWFDYWLKGIDNGIMEEKPIAFPICSYDFKTKSHCTPDHLTWRSECAWPVGHGSVRRFYPAKAPSSAEGSGVLLAAPGAGQAQEYTAVYGVTTSVESASLTGSGSGAGDVGLTYTGAPLPQDYEVIGHPMAHLRFSLELPGWARNPDIDFFVSLCDYDPETDTDYQVTEGHLRASLRRPGENCPYDFLGLPWFENLSGVSEYLEPGKAYTLNFDMLPVFYRFKAGHCLRIVIANSSDRTYYHGRREFERNPDCAKPVIRLLLGGQDATYIELPNIYELERTCSHDAP